MDLTALVVTLADAADGWDHHDWGGGWWVVMVAGMALFWGLVIAAIVWLARGGLGGHGARRSAGTQRTSALDVLDRRFAEGEIDLDEYRQRRAALRDEG